MNNRTSTTIVTLMIFLAILLVATGCGKKDPDKSTATATTLAQQIESQAPARKTNTPRPGETQTAPAIALADSTVTNVPAAGTAALSVSGSATPTACELPAGWIVYTILPGDTLSSLAQNTGSTVEEIQQANCMSGDLIIAYEQIHLRRRPPAPPPAPAPRQPTEDCSSIFSCQNPNLPSLALGGGGGNVETISPCQDGKTIPRIDHIGRDLDSVERLLGFPSYFYACGFSEPDNLTAKLTGPAGYELKAMDFDVLPPGTILNDNDKSARLFPWYPICDVPVGPYTLTISNPSGSEKAILEVNLMDAGYPTILVIPVSLKQGSQFEIYYCGYSNHANQTVQFDLHAKTDQKNEVGAPIYRWLRFWTIDINSKGWAHQTQILPFEDPENPYHIGDHPKELDGEVFFWVVP